MQEKADLGKGSVTYPFPVFEYENSLNHLTGFIRKKYNVSDVPFSKLDLSFIEACDFYLRVELKLKSNTILGIVRHIRKMIKLAIAEGIIYHDPFDGYAPECPKAEHMRVLPKMGNCSQCLVFVG